jgi:predicted RNase H-like HicB family nuclease
LDYDTEARFAEIMFFQGDKPMSEYHVSAVWDDEAKVWVGTSEDIPGLCVEAGTLEELTQAAGELIPDLLILNGVLPQDDTSPVPFRITAERTALARI